MSIGINTSIGPNISTRTADRFFDAVATPGSSWQKAVRNPGLSSFLDKILEKMGWGQNIDKIALGNQFIQSVSKYQEYQNRLEEKASYGYYIYNAMTYNPMTYNATSSLKTRLNSIEMTPGFSIKDEYGIDRQYFLREVVNESEKYVEFVKINNEADHESEEVISKKNGLDFQQILYAGITK